MKKIWDKGFDNDPRIDAFTVGKDRELDLLLAPYDIEGTMAHIKMLSEVGLLESGELRFLTRLKNCTGRLLKAGLRYTGRMYTLRLRPGLDRWGKRYIPAAHAMTRWPWM